jgi:hypothetical protein
MNRVSERAAGATRKEARQSLSLLSIVAGGLQGMVIGLQIALLAILGAIPATWFGSLPVGEPWFNSFLLTAGALAGAVVTAVAVMVSERRAGRKR